jgi:glycosyltransferase involved in cell wall biosynthesis
VEQLRSLARYVRWLPRSPRVVHVCVSSTATGLPRDTLYVALLAAARRRPIAHVHNGNLELTLRSRGSRVALKTIGRLATEVVAVSPRPAAELEAAGIEATHVFNPSTVSPNGAGRVRNEALEVLFVGAYCRLKGVDDLLVAVARVREAGCDVRLRIVGPPGHPSEAQRLPALVRELGLDEAVGLVGAVPPGRIADELDRADVFCLPSYHEGLPMTVLEAMGAGLPVVASDVGGIPDLVRDGETGTLVSPGNVEALAAALRALAEDPALRLRLGEAGRGAVSELAGEPVVTARWREIYAHAAA